MGFQAEFASYEPLRRLRDSEAVKNLETRFKLYLSRWKNNGFW